MDKDAKEARNKRIFDLWLACWTQEEIAEELSTPQKSVDDVIKTFSENGKPANLAKSDRAVADHATDFDPPLYNIWKQQEKTRGSNHFGNTETRWAPIAGCLRACARGAHL
jgi:hypothetical protein